MDANWTERLRPAMHACQMSQMQRYAGNMQLVVVAFWKCTKDAHRDGGDDQRPSESLHEDGVLDLPKSRLLDPDFTIKDFADDFAFLVFGDPGFVFVAVGAAKSIERTFAQVQGGFIVVFDEKLPWSEMAMVHAVEDLRRISNGNLVYFQ